MNILTFDIEEWFVYGVHSHYGDSKNYLPRINQRLEEILDLLDKYDTSATFFCLGEVARKFPSVIKLIDSRGHHIGCHSNEHKFLGEMTKKEFESDTKIGIDSIENAIGKKINSYRAPAFSISEQSAWALEILSENGIEYDCSIFPGSRRFGGYPSFGEVKPAVVNYNGCMIKEFPIPLINFFGKRVAFSGGGYFRMLPYFASKLFMKDSAYIMSYFHIRDFDEKMFEELSFSKTNMNPIVYFKNFYGIRGAFSKFQTLIHDFDFVDVEEASRLINWDNVPVVNIRDGQEV